MFRRLYSLGDFSRETGPLHLAIGVFDGVHLGHRAVIGAAITAAKVDGGRAIVVTFSPHPIEVVAPDKAPKALLSSLDEKLELLEEAGADGTLIIAFNDQFAAIEAESFVAQLMQAPVASIAVGSDWGFGKGRKGNIELLSRLSERYGYELQAVAPVDFLGERISSTRTRKAIRAGDLDLAKSLLGRAYLISGEVIKGKQNGRAIGFPTANLSVESLQCPKPGVWIVRVDGQHDGVANIGSRPTVSGKGLNLEVHFLDFSKDLYGKKIHVEFLFFIREERNFGSLDALKNQIGKDIKIAKRWLTEH